MSATTPAERFAAWLAPAMRKAGLEIDGQLGGGRAALADAVGVSRSTVTRWLSGQTMPAPEQFEPLAKALGIPVLAVLVGGGIISDGSLPAAGTRAEPLSPEQLVARLGITDPADRSLILAMVERMKELHREREEARLFLAEASAPNEPPAE